MKALRRFVAPSLRRFLLLAIGACLSGCSTPTAPPPAPAPQTKIVGYFFDHAPDGRPVVGGWVESPVKPATVKE